MQKNMKSYHGDHPGYQKLILRVTSPPQSVQTWRFPASKFDRPCPFMNL